MQKAQGALEYLMLLGGAIVIAAIVIAIILGLGSTQSSVAQNAAYQAAVKQLSALSGVDLAALQAWYPFDGTYFDTSGKGNHGIPYSGATFVQGKNWQGVYDPSASAYVGVKPEAFNGLGDFTMMLWFNGTINGSPNVIRGSLVGSNKIVLIPYIGSSNIHTSLYPGPGSTELDFSTPSISTNMWHHVAWVRSAGFQTVYYDCVPKNPVGGQTPNSGVISIDTAKIGQFNSGTIDDVLIIGRALQEWEIKALAKC
ncbi:MAG TPA: LamG-like jellyroll fold domain-containing protein [archaeon]|nr:LamG-like jellyroll fold domain-containing protein [archaeon]